MIVNTKIDAAFCKYSDVSMWPSRVTLSTSKTSWLARMLSLPSDYSVAWTQIRVWTAGQTGFSSHFHDEASIWVEQCEERSAFDHYHNKLRSMWLQWVVMTERFLLLYKLPWYGLITIVGCSVIIRGYERGSTSIAYWIRTFLLAACGLDICFMKQSYFVNWIEWKTPGSSTTKFYIITHSSSFNSYNNAGVNHNNVVLFSDCRIWLLTLHAWADPAWYLDFNSAWLLSVLYMYMYIDCWFQGTCDKHWLGLYQGWRWLQVKSHRI